MAGGTHCGAPLRSVQYPLQRMQHGEGVAQLGMGEALMSAANMPRRAELTFPAPQRAVFRSPVPAGWLWEILGNSAVPAAAVVVLVGGFGVAVFLGAAALVLCALGALIVLVSFLASPPRRLGADLDEGLLYVEGLGRRRKRQWPLSDVSGVQLSTAHADGAPPDDVSYEADVVLSPDAEPVRMWISRDRERATRDARRFAAFLGKPFWDHT